MPMPPGPFRQIRQKNGKTAPLYMLTFDEDGRCTAPQTLEALLKDAKAGGYSHVFLVSHGWNNDFETALNRYLGFVAAFQSVMPADSPLMQAGYKPLLVGISWPSIDLLFPWEEPPTLQSADAFDPIPDLDRVAGNDEAEVLFVARLLPEAQRSGFYQLVRSPGPMSELQADELASLLLPLYGTGADPTEPDGVPPSKADLIEFWRGTVAAAKADALSQPGDAAPAALFGFLPDPRDAIRVFTVWKMKDRAGKVGATGVRALLRDLLSATGTSKCHLVGHSFGCKVVMSAVGFGGDLPRPVTSVLLLQPAVNCYCFAPSAAGSGRPGGYRPLLSRIEQPILATFSSHDMPLRKFFHLALWRKVDLGETKIADAGQPPSEYAALGGFGPQGCPPAEAGVIDIKAVGQPYDLRVAGAPKVLGLQGDTAIDGHGGVVNPTTAWALYCQVIG